MVSPVPTVSFWETDWGRIFKAAFMAVLILLTGGIGYVLIRRNRTLKPQREINMDLARKLSNKTVPFITSMPEKYVTTMVSVADTDVAFGTAASVVRSSDKIMEFND